MAITKARTGSVVRGYYVTTINTGRVTQASGAGFGLSRLGGLINAQVEGLSGGGTGASRLAAQVPHFDREAAEREHKEQVKQHEEWKKSVKDAHKKLVAEEKQVDELNKKLGDEAKPSPLNLPHAEVVKDPETNSPRVVAKDKLPAEALDHPVVPKEGVKPEKTPAPSSQAPEKPTSSDKK